MFRFYFFSFAQTYRRAINRIDFNTKAICLRAKKLNLKWFIRLHISLNALIFFLEF